MRSETSPIRRFAFIVGAPRCGTTFLARHLEKHSGICFSNVKEPHFFSGTDLRGVPETEFKRTVERDYLDRFFPHRSRSPFLAEGSVTYLYTPEQVKPLLRLWPDAKFIIAVRNPLEMVPSLHRRLLCIGDETVADFERAWRLVEQRRQGRFIPRRCVEPRWLDYWESGKLGHYVTKFIETVGRERCFISLYDDLESDPGGQYRRILEFLDLPHDGQSEFGLERQSKAFKIGWLQRLLKRPPRAAIALLGTDAHRLRFSKKPVGSDRPFSRRILSFRKRLLAWNEAPAPEYRPSAALRSEMLDMFGADIRLLGQTIGRDLDHWLKPPHAGKRQAAASRKPRRRGTAIAATG